MPEANSLRTAFSSLAIAALFLAYILPGLTGHDPWKQDEGYSFGVINHVLRTGDWVVPTLAGEPFMEKPPLYYVTAAGFARLFSPWLPLHDAARLATGFYIALAFLFAGLAGRECWGRGKGLVTVLILSGSVGLMGHSHEMITDAALLAGFSVAIYGLVLGRRRPVAGGVALGTGIGVGFLSKGVIAPGMMGLVAALLPLVFKTWRDRKFAAVLAVAAVAALPWLTAWPVALYRRSPHLFMEWFWENNWGRFAGSAAYLGANSTPWYYTRTIPWFAWPALPLALWTLWLDRRRVRELPFLQLPLLASAVVLAVLGVSAGARALYALPVLVPLSLLAAKAADALPHGVADWVDRFHVGLFGLIAATVWLFWLSMVALGRPPDFSALYAGMPMDYRLAFDPLSVAVAAVFTLAWGIALGMRRFSPRPVWSWFLGMTLAWSLVSFLLLPWIDAARSYRSTFESMLASIGPGETRIVSAGLGECQRAMLESFAGIVATRLEADPGARADLLLMQHSASATPGSPGLPWRKIWEGSRPGDSTERYSLFRR